MRARDSHPPSEPCRRSRSSVWVRASVLRDPTVGVSVESPRVLFILVTPSQQCLESKLGFFFFLALWVVGIEEFQMMVTVQIKLPLCFTQTIWKAKCKDSSFPVTEFVKAKEVASFLTFSSRNSTWIFLESRPMGLGLKKG
ncbi:uncharacterized protein ACIBXB_001158 isoform 2-T2 [Morphnus guianensis]